MYCDIWRKSAEFPQEPRLLSGGFISKITLVESEEIYSD